MPEYPVALGERLSIATHCDALRMGYGLVSVFLRPLEFYALHTEPSRLSIGDRHGDGSVSHRVAHGAEPHPALHGFPS